MFYLDFPCKFSRGERETPDFLTGERRKIKGVTNNTNDGSVPFSFPIKPSQCDSEQGCRILVQ